MKPFRLPHMDSNEIEELLDNSMICRIAFKGDDFPYIAPFHYVKHNDCLYFHFTGYGRKIRYIEQDNRVCVSVEKLTEDMSSFKFAVLNGRLEKVMDPEERSKVIQILAEMGKQNFSDRFLTVHGFKDEKGWSSLKTEQNMIIFKLLKDEELGLKSP